MTGLWRCGGRLTNAEIPYTTKHPVLLPRSHPLTTLIVRDAHDRVWHNGVKETLREIRRKFWIVKGQSLGEIRSFIAVSYAGGLKEFHSILLHHHRCRVREEPPFTCTGVGPLCIRSFGSTRTNKAWICLFACLVTRAVHLDITTDLSTETFIRCLKRFAARRGLPRKFLSDNGKTFIATAKFIKTVFQDETGQNHLAGNVFSILRRPRGREVHSREW